MLNLQKVLVPVDFSDFSKASLERCGQLFSGDTAKEFHFIYVWQAPADEVTWDAEPQKDLEKKLKEFISNFPNEDNHSTYLQVLTGHAATKICDYATAHSCDLIVLSSHGRTGIRRMLIGSTTEKVVRHAPCPILVLKRAELLPSDE